MSGALILMYHIVDAPRVAAEEKYCCTPEGFERQMRHLREDGYRTLALETLLAALDSGEQSQDRAVAVTFDDGFACMHRIALPILLKYKIPATVFVPSDRIGGSNDWMRSHAAAPRALVSAAEVRELDRAGVTIGSHTRTHPRLTEIEPERIGKELRGSKAALEELLGKRVEYFAYPYGAYNEAVRDEVERAGYIAACSTRPGFNRGTVDRFLLRRIEVYGSDTPFRFRQKIKFGANQVSAFFPVRYYAGRLAARARLRVARSGDA